MSILRDGLHLVDDVGCHLANIFLVGRALIKQSGIADEGINFFPGSFIGRTRGKS